MLHLIHRTMARIGADERGASLVEYVLLVGLIALVAFTAVVFFGSQLGDKYSSIASNFPS